jgi:hypothetical protein
MSHVHVAWSKRERCYRSVIVPVATTDHGWRIDVWSASYDVPLTFSCCMRGEALKHVQRLVCKQYGFRSQAAVDCLLCPSLTDVR